MPGRPQTYSLVQRVSLAIGLGTALSLMGDTAIYAVLPTHTAAAGVSLASVGVLLSANRWIRLVTNALLGRAYDRWPHRWIFVTALFIGALSTAMYALTEGFWPLLAARLVWGLAWSGIWVGGNLIILDVTTQADRGRWTGLYQLSFYMGSTIGFPTGGMLTDWLGYRPAMWVAACVTSLGALAVLWLLPETRRPQKPGEPATLGEGSPAGGGSPNGSVGAGPGPLPVHPARADVAERSAGGRPALAAATALYTGNRFVAAGVLSATLGLLIQQRWGDARLGDGSPVGVATLTGGLLGFHTLVSMLSAPVAGHWSDLTVTRWHVAAAGLVPGVAGLGLMVRGGAGLILLAVPLSAMTSGSSQSISTVLLGDLTVEERRGRALAWLHSFGDLGSAVAPPLAYALLPAIGLSGIYLACAAWLSGMFLLALRMARPRPGAETKSD